MSELSTIGLGGRKTSGEERQGDSTKISLDLLKAVAEHPDTRDLMEMADEFTKAMGFTEHGLRHGNLVGNITANVLAHLGYDQRTVELGAVSGFLHDIGCVVSRLNHGQTSGILAYNILKELDVPMRDIAVVMGAVGNHEEQYGVAVHPVSAAVILADKADVHRSRVRDNGDIINDIHDRVNYAVTGSFLRVAEHVVDPDAPHPYEIHAGAPGIRLEDGIVKYPNHRPGGPTDVRAGAETGITLTDSSKKPQPSVALPGIQVTDGVMRTITLELTVDTTVTAPYEFFEIFLNRMNMCRMAARTLGCEFRITINDVAWL